MMSGAAASTKSTSSPPIAVSSRRQYHQKKIHSPPVNAASHNLITVQITGSGIPNGTVVNVPVSCSVAAANSTRGAVEEDSRRKTTLRKVTVSFEFSTDAEMDSNEEEAAAAVPAVHHHPIRE